MISNVWLAHTMDFTDVFIWSASSIQEYERYKIGKHMNNIPLSSTNTATTILTFSFMFVFTYIVHAVDVWTSCQESTTQTSKHTHYPT